MTERVDARGLSCPQPLMLALEAMKKNVGPLTVIVDTESATESIERAVKREKRVYLIVRTGSVATFQIEGK
ncbi:MAG: sulfurtransferase TusA family protein [Deltaproteobacteria bacterium]|nr:sulfurtransferase TusA family protein [Deltaproteobacteria bacterium]